jgi:hypothetical protein
MRFESNRFGFRKRTKDVRPDCVMRQGGIVLLRFEGGCYIIVRHDRSLSG